MKTGTALGRGLGVGGGGRGTDMGEGRGRVGMWIVGEEQTGKGKIREGWGKGGRRCTEGRTRTCLGKRA